MSNSEVIIALMGPTGTGKSTFINLLTGDTSIRVGHGLDSQTFDVRTSSCMVADRRVTFIDTPGFDDSHEGVTDTDILGKITDFLQGSGSQGINGIIYLHRISDPRMGGTAKKNLRMFRELCGDDNLTHVRIITTMWADVKEKNGKRRQAELAQGPFGPVIECGAKMFAHDGKLESAQSIVSQLMQVTPVRLKIQKELDDGRALGDTSAGAIIIEEMKELKEKHEQEMAELKKEMEDASTTNEDLAELAEDCRKLEAMVKRAERELSILSPLAPPVQPRPEEEHPETSRHSARTPPKKIQNESNSQPNQLRAGATHNLGGTVVQAVGSSRPDADERTPPPAHSSSGRTVERGLTPNTTFLATLGSFITYISHLLFK